VRQRALAWGALLADFVVSVTGSSQRRSVLGMHGCRRAQRAVWVAACCVIGILLTACGVARQPGKDQVRPAASTSAQAVTVASNRRAARREANALLSRVLLPEGAVQVWSEPVGDRGALARPAQVPGLADLVDLHGWWRVAGSEKSVYSFIKAHVPDGARLDGWGRRYPRPSAAFVDFALAPVNGVFEARDLNITIAPLGLRSVGVRVDAQVVWTFPKPPGEHLPSTIGAIHIVREAGHLPRAAATVTAPAKVDRLVARFNALPIEQPGTFLGCPFEGPQPTIVFSFRTSVDTSPVAVLTYTGSCGGSPLRIHGRVQHPLDGAYSLVRTAQHLTGLKLIPYRVR
jgi:hypothetical protein